MFNVTKALKKLDEIYDKSIIPSPVIKHIREILLAGQEDEVEEIKSLKDSQESVKWTLNSARKNIDRIEERLARLEEDITRVGDRLSDHIEPEKPVTDALSIGHLSDIGALKQKGAKLKPVTEEKSCYLQERGEECPVHDKPSEFIQIPRNVAEEIESNICELIDLMDSVNDGEYAPDCFTTQPCKKSLSEIRNALKG